MALYDYTSQSNDLANRYTQDRAVNDYARFISQRRSKRSLEDAGRQFARGIPAFQGRIIRSGHGRGGVQSGRAIEGIGQHAEDYARGYNRMLEDEAGREGQFQANQAQMEANYQAQLRALYERMMMERGGVDPFAALRGLI